MDPGLDGQAWEVSLHAFSLASPESNLQLSSHAHDDAHSLSGCPFSSSFSFSLACDSNWQHVVWETSCLDQTQSGMGLPPIQCGKLLKVQMPHWQLPLGTHQ